MQCLQHRFHLHLVLLCPCQALVLGPDMAVPAMQPSQDKMKFWSLRILLGLASEVFKGDSALMVCAYHVHWTESSGLNEEVQV